MTNSSSLVSKNMNSDFFPSSAVWQLQLLKHQAFKLQLSRSIQLLCIITRRRGQDGHEKVFRNRQSFCVFEYKVDKVLNVNVKDSNYQISTPNHFSFNEKNDFQFSAPENEAWRDLRIVEGSIVPNDQTHYEITIQVTTRKRF